jgi:transposase
VSGIVVGGFGYRAYNMRVAPPPKAPEKRSPEEFRRQLIQEMTKEVHLDDQQVTQLKQIYEETTAAFTEARARENTKLHAEGQTIHDQQVEKIKKILRPDQIPLYDALRARHEAERAARHKGDIKKDQ